MKNNNILPIVKTEEFKLINQSAFSRRLESEKKLDPNQLGLAYYLDIDSNRYFNSLDGNEKFDFPYNYIRKCSKNINLNELLEYFDVTYENYDKYLEIKNEK